MNPCQKIKWSMLIRAGIKMPDVVDGGILLDKVLDGLLALVGLWLTGLLLSLFNFLDELLECLFQHLSSDLAD